MKNLQSYDDFLTESSTNKKIEVTIYGGKIIEFDNSDIQDFIDNLGDYMGADNLPKWLLVAGMHNRKFPRNTIGVENMLRQILNAKNNVFINVRPDKFYENQITGI
jgi:histone acetyltransferase (RNA polymerase elongator complex component)